MSRKRKTTARKQRANATKTNAAKTNAAKTNAADKPSPTKNNPSKKTPVNGAKKEAPSLKDPTVTQAVPAPRNRSGNEKAPSQVAAESETMRNPTEDDAWATKNLSSGTKNNAGPPNPSVPEASQSASGKPKSSAKPQNETTPKQPNLAAQTKHTPNATKKQKKAPSGEAWATKNLKSGASKSTSGTKSESAQIAGSRRGSETKPGDTHPKNDRTGAPRTEEKSAPPSAIDKKPRTNKGGLRPTNTSPSTAATGDAGKVTAFKDWANKPTKTPSAVIDARQVSKEYAISGGNEERSLRSLLGRKQTTMALHPVDIRINSGDSIGIIGRNGSGKSTLLRVLAGLTAPTTGSVAWGERPTFLSIGAALAPALSGRENVETLALLGGVARQDRARHMDEALEFADLGAYADQPLRTYSTGMRMRLAFGALLATEPRLLMLDEVLAVGDAKFRGRCIERLHSLRASGTTLLLTSHDAGQVAAMCERTLLLADGALVSDGPTEAVVNAYNGDYRPVQSDKVPAAVNVDASLPPHRPELLAEVSGPRVPQGQPKRQSALDITDLWLGGPDGTPVTAIPAGRSFTVNLNLECFGTIVNPIVSVAVLDVDAPRGEPVFRTNTHQDKAKLGRLRANSQLTVEVSDPKIEVGDYALGVAIFSEGWEEELALSWGETKFSITEAVPTDTRRTWSVSPTIPRAIRRSQ